MKTLGIKAPFHDSSACLVHDGAVVAAAEEERFTQIKHGKPPGAILGMGVAVPRDRLLPCRSRHGTERRRSRRVFAGAIAARERERTAASITLPLEPSSAPRHNGGAPWDPLFLSYVVNAPRQFAGGAPHHLDRRLRAQTDRPSWQWHYVAHHLAHQASALLAAPF